MLATIIKILKNPSRKKPIKSKPKSEANPDLFVQCKLCCKVDKSEPEKLSTTTMWLPCKLAHAGVSMSFEDLGGIWTITEIFDGIKVTGKDIDEYTKRNHKLSNQD